MTTRKLIALKYLPNSAPLIRKFRTAVIWDHDL